MTFKTMVGPLSIIYLIYSSILNQFLSKISINFINGHLFS